MPSVFHSFLHRNPQIPHCDGGALQEYSGCGITGPVALCGKSCLALQHADEQYHTAFATKQNIFSVQPLQNKKSFAQDFHLYESQDM